MQQAIRALLFACAALSAPVAQAEVPTGLPDCGAATRAVDTLVCETPLLSGLEQELAGALTRYADENARRPQRIRNLPAQQARWRDRLGRCGADVACVSEQYIDRIEDLERTWKAPPRDWSATRATVAELAVAARANAGSEFVSPGEQPPSLVGMWKGAFACAGRSGTMELAVAPGFAGTMTAFMAMWESEPGEPLSRGDFNVLRAAEAGTFVLSLRDSRIRVRKPYMPAFTRVALAERGDVVHAEPEGARCEPITLARTEQAASLDAALAQAAASRRKVWDWPYDPADLPSPELAAFCEGVLQWTQRLTEHFPEADVGRMGVEYLERMATNLLDDPYFVEVAGAPYDRLDAASRKALSDRMSRECMRNPIIARAQRSEPNGIFRVLGAQEGTHGHDRALAALSDVRAARAWADDARGQAAAAAPSARWQLAVALGEESKAKIAALLPGDVAAFEADMMDVRRASARAHADAVVAAAKASASGVDQLHAIAAALKTLQAPIGDMTEADRAAFVADMRAEEDAIIATAIVAERDAIGTFGDGLAALEKGRAWYGAFLVAFGNYRDRPDVAATLAAFGERRLADVRDAGDAFVGLIAAAESETAYNALAARMIVPETDRQVAAVDAAIAAREAVFARERLLAGLSPYEKTLADANGNIVVPASYPEPTDEEMKLAIAREYGAYGQVAADGSFTYGLIPETSIQMRVIRVTKVGCSPNGAGGYRCAREVVMEMEQSSAMRSVLGGSIQGDIMDGLLDFANRVESEVMEDDFILTPGGWRSPTIAAAAARGIARSIETVGEAVSGFGCGLAQLADVGDC